MQKKLSEYFDSVFLLHFRKYSGSLFPAFVNDIYSCLLKTRVLKISKYTDSLFTQNILYNLYNKPWFLEPITFWFRLIFGLFFKITGVKKWPDPKKLSHHKISFFTLLNHMKQFFKFVHIEVLFSPLFAWPSSSSHYVAEICFYKKIIWPHKFMLTSSN